MPTLDTYPRFPKRNLVLDGGHYRRRFSFGDFESSDSVLLGRYHQEMEVDYEKCTVCRGLGEPVEVIVKNREVEVCYDNRIRAVYDRTLGTLVCASFSLIQGFLEVSQNDIRMNRVAKKMKELSRAGSDIVVVVNLDNNGEVRASLVLSDRGGVCRPLAGAKMTDRVQEEGEEDGGEDELLQTWHCISPIGGIDFCVGMRVFVLDLVIVNPDTQEGTPFHVAQELDFSLLDRERINPGLVLQLAEAAFPGLDWV